MSDPTNPLNDRADPQRLLPPDVRSDWAVVPRDSLYQLVLVGALLGAGAALSVVGFVQGTEVLWLGFPIGVVLCLLQKWLIPWSERRLLQRLQERGVVSGGGQRK